MNLPALHGNYIDLIILVVVIYFASEAWRYGFWVVLADFLSFLLSLLISLRAYTFGAKILENNFSLPHSIANALGFMLVATLSEALLGFAFASLLKKIPYKFWKKPWNNLAGMIPAAGQGLIIVSFLLTLLIGLPIKPQIKTDITDSKIGSYLVDKTASIEASLSKVFGGLIEDSLTYLTIKEGSGESVSLNNKVLELTIDEKSEKDMVDLVNKERRERGIPELSLRSELTPIARERARDMWERNYFGHITPDGKDVSDYLNEQSVPYGVVGENLALAPTLATAHTGLMNSPGHKANILNTEYKRIGIGVVDNGYYGKMFVQIFTD